MAESYDLDKIYRDELDAAAKEMQERIDRSVMMNLLESIGWHRVNSMKIIKNPALALEVSIWASENKISCIGQDGTYVLKNERDAVLFTLKWT